jgi:hypothetical protein
VPVASRAKPAKNRATEPSLMRRTAVLPNMAAQHPLQSPYGN